MSVTRIHVRQILHEVTSIEADYTKIMVKAAYPIHSFKKMLSSLAHCNTYCQEIQLTLANLFIELTDYQNILEKISSPSDHPRVMLAQLVHFKVNNEQVLREITQFSNELQKISKSIAFFSMRINVYQQTPQIIAKLRTQTHLIHHKNISEISNKISEIEQLSKIPKKILETFQILKKIKPLIKQLSQQQLILGKVDSLSKEIRDSDYQKIVTLSKMVESRIDYIKKTNEKINLAYDDDLKNIASETSQAVWNKVIKETINEIRYQIQYYNYQYYQKSISEITDEQYDQLFSLLNSIEDAFSSMTGMSPSPTKHVGSDLDPKLEKVTHSEEMKSMANLYDANESLSGGEGLNRFSERVKSYLNGYGQRLIFNSDVGTIPLKKKELAILLQKNDDMDNQDDINHLKEQLKRHLKRYLQGIPYITELSYMRAPVKQQHRYEIRYQFYAYPLKLVYKDSKLIQCKLVLEKDSVDMMPYVHCFNEDTFPRRLMQYGMDISLTGELVILEPNFLEHVLGKNKAQLLACICDYISKGQIKLVLDDFQNWNSVDVMPLVLKEEKLISHDVFVSFGDDVDAMLDDMCQFVQQSYSKLIDKAYAIKGLQVRRCYDYDNIESNLDNFDFQLKTLGANDTNSSYLIYEKPVDISFSLYYEKGELNSVYPISKSSRLSVPNGSNNQIKDRLIQLFQDSKNQIPKKLKDNASGFIDIGVYLKHSPVDKIAQRRFMKQKIKDGIPPSKKEEDKFGCFAFYCIKVILDAPRYGHSYLDTWNNVRDDGFPLAYYEIMDDVTALKAYVKNKYFHYQRRGATYFATQKELASNIEGIQIIHNSSLSFLDKNIEYVLEPKIDGVSLILRYAKGKLTHAITRGDGKEGNDVTANIRMLSSIPSELKEPVDLELRGEIYFPKSEFLAFKQKMEQAEKNKEQEQGELYKSVDDATSNKPISQQMNPRNLASGSIKLLNPDEMKERKLKFYAYDIIPAADVASNEVRPLFYHVERLQYLKKEGFRCVPYEVHHDMNTLKMRLDRWGEKRHSLDCVTDGMVIKLNSIMQRKILGNTPREYRWLMAYKFASLQKETVIEDVLWSVGRLGWVTPVAVVSPVDLDGSRVSRISLHNLGQFERLNLKQGSRVIVSKAGEVIPQIDEVLLDSPEKESLKNKLLAPKYCPSCEHALSIEQKSKQGNASQETTKMLRCFYRDCKQQMKKRIEYFVSKDAMNIDSLGPSTIDILMEKGLIADYADLYALTYDQLISLDGILEKTALNLLSAIKKSKDVASSRLLVALGIPNVGRQLAEKIVQKISSWDELQHKTIDDWVNDPDLSIGKEIASNLVHFFQDEAQLKIVRKLKQWNIDLNPKSIRPASNNESKSASNLFSEDPNYSLF